MNLSDKPKSPNSRSKGEMVLLLVLMILIKIKGKYIVHTFTAVNITAKIHR